MPDEKRLTPEQAFAGFMAADEAFKNAQSARYKAERGASDLRETETTAKRARDAAQKALLDVLGVKEGRQG